MKNREDYMVDNTNGGIMDNDCAVCKNREGCTCADLWGICDEYEDMPEDQK